MWRSGVAEFLRRMRRNPLSIAGLVLVCFFVLVAILAPVLAPPPEGWRNPYQIPNETFAPDPRPPRPGYPFGTTSEQYDLYYGVVWGTRTAFRVSLTVIAISVAVGLVIGGLAGYRGGLVDEVFMRITDVFLAFPGLILAVVIVAILGKGLDKVLMALALVSWPTYTRLLRGEILSAKERDFVEAARALGASDFRVFFRHVLPNTIYPVVVYGSLDMGSVVISAAALSFLGLGAEVGYADWGQLINLSRPWIIGAPGNALQYWYTLVYPGLAISLFVLGWNLLGDAFRDIMDPKLRGQT
ncbi:MAG: ABC transporter permease [Armatimonadota bacterium]|nr:ABC transporter permease [Armatimonadota bacterium]MDR5696891.1 ABC transporter permease [Armatimonadota bacterium]